MTSQINEDQFQKQRAKKNNNNNIKLFNSEEFEQIEK